MKYDTYLPILSSFDACLWEFDIECVNNDIIYTREENGLYSAIDKDDINIDYENYEINIAKQVCDIIQNNMSDYINKIDFQNIQKNSVNINIDINENLIADFIYKNKAEFIEYLKNHYTSYDGFLSHYSHYFETWEVDTKNFTDFSFNEHYLGSVLQFISNILDITEFNLYDDIEFDYLEYVLNLDELLQKTDNSLFEYLTSHNINKKYADYINTLYINNNNIENLCFSEDILTLINNFTY